MRVRASKKRKKIQLEFLSHYKVIADMDITDNWIRVDSWALEQDGCTWKRHEDAAALLYSMPSSAAGPTLIIRFSCPVDQAAAARLIRRGSSGGGAGRHSEAVKNK